MAGLTMPTPQPGDIISTPNGPRHLGELTDPDFECDQPECGCHHKEDTC